MRTARRRAARAREFAEEHGITFITVAQLVAHRLKSERLVHRVAEARLPTEHGSWRIVGYKNDVDVHEHVALVYGDIGDGEDVPRPHSTRSASPATSSTRCAATAAGSSIRR
jgi:3,4-dihydroxy 2-butanone 4-phosphate synthase/GTP cyclohydrolase II